MNGWISADEYLPDDDEMVLIALVGSDYPVWIGYHDSERAAAWAWKKYDGWFASNGDPVHVTHWKDLPEGPHAARVPEDRMPDAWSGYCMAFRDLFGPGPELELSPSALQEFASRWAREGRR